MSFIIAVFVNEGIVLASDSRTTYTSKKKVEDEVVLEVGSHITDSTDKTFCCPNGAGISTCGDASINNKPLTGYIQNMIREKINKETLVEDVPGIIVEYFNEFSVVPNSNFIVAGYSMNEITKVQKVFKLNVKSKEIKEVKTVLQGATWDGQTSIMVKLFQPVYFKNEDDTYADLGAPEILWNYLTLQDAVDFARYAVETTIQTMRFQKCVKTVGGPVDILVITPDETKWLQKKELL